MTVMPQKVIELRKNFRQEIFNRKTQVHRLRRDRDYLITKYTNGKHIS